MRDAAIERQARVIPVVDPVVGVARIRRPGADLEILCVRKPTVAAERTPELRVGIRQAIRVAASAGSEIVARVVPDYRQVAGRLIERDLRQELAVRRRVVVYPYRCAPGHALVIRVSNEDIGVVALVLDFEGVDEVHAAVVRAARPVPGQPWLRVDRAIWLGRDEIKAAHVGVDHVGAAAAERLRSEAIGIDVHE